VTHRAGPLKRGDARAPRAGLGRASSRSRIAATALGCAASIGRRVRPPFHQVLQEGLHCSVRVPYTILARSAEMRYALAANTA